MKIKSMRTQKMTQTIISTNLKRLMNSQSNKHTENSLKYWLLQQKQLSASITKSKKGVNDKA